MTRLFLVFATLTGLALTASIVSGIVSWLHGGLTGEGSLYLTHFVIGLFSAVAVLLIHCLAITYFLGTGRWVKEVCLAYGLPDERWPRQTRDIKRGNTPYAILAMLVTIGTAAAGQGRFLLDWPAWLHALGAAATLLLNAVVWVVEYRNMKRNIRILDEVYAAVDRLRAEQGLPTNEEALRREQGPI
jgi:hypothetical protein